MSQILLSSFATPAAPKLLYGVRDGAGTAANNKIAQINKVSVVVSNSHQLTLGGFTIFKTVGLAALPSNGTLFAIVQTNNSDPTARRLVTLDSTTGTCTDVGSLGDAFSSLAFRSTGVLYGITGPAANVPTQLYTIDTTTAAITSVVNLPNGGNGESIVFHQNGLLYHYSWPVFESVDVDSLVVTNISSSETLEQRGMSYGPDDSKIFAIDGGTLKTISISTGVLTSIGTVSDSNFYHGIAFA